jgi:hypothetical protein
MTTQARGKDSGPSTLAALSRRRRQPRDLLNSPVWRRLPLGDDATGKNDRHLMSLYCKDLCNSASMSAITTSSTRLRQRFSITLWVAR